MMVKFLRCLSGRRYSYAVGQVVPLDDDLARKLCAGGICEPAEGSTKTPTSKGRPAESKKGRRA